MTINVLMLAALGGRLQSQSPAPTSVFAVASIKPTDPAFTGHAFRAPHDNDSVNIRGWTLREVIRFSFSSGIFGSIMPAELVAGGPTWLDEDRFDISAKAQGRPSQDDRRQMLRALLVERFKLALHYEPKETSVYLLVLGKNGPKMKQRRPDDGGEPYMIRDRGNTNFICRNTSMVQLANFLASTSLGRPVVDRTDLAGTFDFELGWGQDPSRLSVQESTGHESELPTMFDAIQGIGLKLQAAKAAVDFLMIDHVEKPSGN